MGVAGYRHVHRMAVTLEDESVSLCDAADPLAWNRQASNCVTGMYWRGEQQFIVVATGQRENSGESRVDCLQSRAQGQGIKIQFGTDLRGTEQVAEVLSQSIRDIHAGGGQIT